VLSLPITAGSGSGVGNGNTFQFSTITDGEGIFIDDNINDQGSMNLPYPGRTQVQNNIAVGSGNCGVCQYKSGHVDFSFNTTYNNMTSNPVPEQGEMSDSQGTDTNFYYNLMINTGTHAILPDLSASTTTYAYNAGNGAGTMSGTNNVTATLNLVNTTIVMPYPDTSACPDKLPGHSRQSRDRRSAIFATIHSCDRYSRQSWVGGSKLRHGGIRVAMFDLWC
jgi:hypothetical protein